MKTNWMNRGMTITELVVVLGLIVILTLTSIPIFFHLTESRRTKEMKEQLSLVEAQIAAWHYQKLILENNDIYPEMLDANPFPAPCVSCFDSVLEKGISNQLWFKLKENEYSFGKQYRISYQPQTGVILTSAIQ